MKKYYALVAFALLCGLYIYTVYRSEQTVVNLLLHNFFGTNFLFFKAKLHLFETLPNWVLYNLPSSLWLFAATLLTRNLYLGRLHLAFSPLFFIIFLEFLQYTHLTNGTFDGLDIVFAVIFSILAFCIKCPFALQKCTEKPFLRIYLCFFVGFIVYLAEFWG